MALDPDFVSILICPESGAKLEVASEGLIKSINEQISTGSVTNRSGTVRTEPIEAALVTRDGSRVFEVVGEIPNLVMDDAIDLKTS